jgi:hypothetical protein
MNDLIVPSLLWFIYGHITREQIAAGGYEMGCVQNFGGARGSVLVEALCHKRNDDVSDFFFSIYLILPAALGPGVDSADNRNV